MKKVLVGFGFLLLGCPAAKGAVEEVCGPCPDVTDGDLLVTGSAQIDGMFKALNIFQNASTRISGEFEAHITAIGDAFGVARKEGESIADYATAVRAEVQAQIDANIEGDLRVDYVPPQCSASVNVMVEAQAECQIDASCTPPKITPGSVVLSCEGQCTGGCSGMCSGSCAVEVTGGECSGSCEGACDLSVGGSCSGTCNGTCDGSCELRDSKGTCKGQCDGTCTGSCELAVAADCSGSCSGKCVAPMAEASCEGQCRGSCNADCSGSCTGSATPPMVSGGSCEAEADCNASASAQASASLECTPPRLSIDYSFAASVDASAQASFLAKFTVFKTEVVGILQGFANARLLVEGDADLNIPAIQDVIAGQIEATADIDADALSNITPYGAICAAASLGDAVTEVGAAATELTVTLEAQIDFVAMLGV